MRPIAKIISWIALAATIAPALLYLSGNMDIAPVKTWMLVATVAWFVTVPLWMDRKAS